MLSDGDRDRLKSYVEPRMKEDVRLIVFTQETECQFCKEAREMAYVLSSISAKVKVEVCDFLQDAEKVKELQIDKIPAIAVLGKRDYGIRFYGVPSGYEFMSLVDAIIDVSTGTTHLTEKTKQRIRALNKAIHIQVFVTPTCPYCPRAVRVAHQLAVESERIKADMVESIEFPQLAQRYSVMAVPKIVINEKIEFAGVLPEEHFVEHVLLAAESAAS